MVRRVRTVHVPMPRRYIPLRRQTRFGTTAASAVSIQIQSRERQALDLRRPIADAGPAISMIERLKALGRWFDARLKIGDTITEVAEHPVPRSAVSWWYVFGSATLVVFILQVVTGICLATVYTPAADRAWQSLLYLNYQQPLGWYLRALHCWGSNFLVALMIIHLLQVFVVRRLQISARIDLDHWMYCSLCTLVMALTGEVLRFDQESYWGLGIGARSPDALR